MIYNPILVPLNVCACFTVVAFPSDLTLVRLPLHIMVPAQWLLTGLTIGRHRSGWRMIEGKDREAWESLVSLSWAPEEPSTSHWFMTVSVCLPSLLWIPWDQGLCLIVCIPNRAIKAVSRKCFQQLNDKWTFIFLILYSVLSISVSFLLTWNNSVVMFLIHYNFYFLWVSLHK